MVIASPIFTAPATRPFHMAICDGSLPEILHVRLLSTPQQKQAAAIGSAPLERASSPVRGSERKTAPKVMSANPAPRVGPRFHEMLSM